MDKRGLFITFEGIDGSGKSTQLNKVAEFLKEKNIDCIITRDPGGTDLGSKLRNILLNYEGKIYPLCELFLYLADRAQHVDEKIIPALNSGTVVLCDRYIDSTIAYQGYARGLNIEELVSLNNFATHTLWPDLTLIFDINPEISLKRVGDNKDRLESESINFHKKVREGYLELAKQHPSRIKIINSNQSIEDIYKDVMQIIKQYFA
ncbi:MAG: Thymidylate kinase [uncultured bacterium]|nr:MAG: Thymidylate kinase [uncultured bacterium]